MSIIKRTATSKKMKNYYNVIKKMSFGMKFDENMVKINWKKARKVCHYIYNFIPKEKDISFKKVTINNVKGIIATPKEITTPGIILFIHGGGFVSGNAKTTKGYISMLSKKVGCKVISIDYSLSPESIYPTPLDDCYNVYKELLKEYKNVALVGESAGANLIIALTVRCITNNIKIPVCLIAHSPILDLTDTLERNYKINDILISPKAIESIKTLYAPNCNYKNPELSPVYFDELSKFPRTVLTCSSTEVLKADSYLMYDKLKNSGVDVTLYEYENTFHAFATLGTLTKETNELLEENKIFLKNNLD
jgi:acetyl esterase/lipase